jgi:hypothetical protein
MLHYAHAFFNQVAQSAACKKEFDRLLGGRALRKVQSGRM